MKRFVVVQVLLDGQLFVCLPGRRKDPCLCCDQTVAAKCSSGGVLMLRAGKKLYVCVCPAVRLETRSKYIK